MQRAFWEGFIADLAIRSRMPQIDRAIRVKYQVSPDKVGVAHRMRASAPTALEKKPSKSKFQARPWKISYRCLHNYRYDCGGSL